VVLHEVQCEVVVVHVAQLLIHGMHELEEVLTKYPGSHKVQ
jgi:hypothetical protein